MTPRLIKIAGYVNKGERLADIGTDHAYIPIYLVQKGIINEAIAADINAAPLKTAAENIKNAGLSRNIKTVLSDGFLCIDKNSFDTAVVAGMGGMLIAEILKNAPRQKKYILQPMKNLPELKRFLSQNGYKITTEGLAAEGEKIYNILVAQDGNEVISEYELFVGKGLADDPLLTLYKQSLKNKFEKIIKGNNQALNPNAKTIDYYKNLLTMLEK